MAIAARLVGVEWLRTTCYKTLVCGFFFKKKNELGKKAVDFQMTKPTWATK